MLASLLVLTDVTVRFGGLTAANQVNLTVHPDQISAVIGPNGAGKTTVFNCVTGVYAPTEGTISLEGCDLRENLTFRIMLRCLGIGVLSGVVLMLAVNIQTLWDASIVQLFVYGHAFPWTLGIKTFFQSITSLPLSSSLAPIVVGLLIGTASAGVMWNRARISPLCAVRRGVARTFQNIRLFKELSVRDNLLVVLDAKRRTNWLSVLFGTPAYRRAEDTRVAQADELLEFVGLSPFADRRADSLPYGYQRRLEIARALAASPKVLLLDEPAAGMNPSEMEALTDLIARIRTRGVTVLLIEHHMKLVMAISDHVTVLEYGEKIAEGSPDYIQRHPKVIAAYLGESADE